MLSKNSCDQIERRKNLFDPPPGLGGDGWDLSDSRTHPEFFQITCEPKNPICFKLNKISTQIPHIRFGIDYGKFEKQFGIPSLCASEGWSWLISVATSKQKGIIMRLAAPFNFFWPTAGYFVALLWRDCTWKSTALARHPFGIPGMHEMERSKN
jgi:hypothetical protein